MQTQTQMQIQTRKSILNFLVHMIEHIKKEPFKTDEWINIERIAAPLSFIKSKPNPEKMKRITKFYIDNGYFDKPIIVQKNENSKNSDVVFLRDGYIRYIIACRNGFKQVPIKWYKKGEINT